MGMLFSGFYVGSAIIVAFQWASWIGSARWPAITLRTLAGAPVHLNSGVCDLFLNQLFDFPLAVLLLLVGFTLTSFRAFVKAG